MYYSVDRIEEDIVVLIDDDNKKVCVSSNALYDGIREGDCLLGVDEGYRLDIEETRKRRADIGALQNELFQ